MNSLKIGRVGQNLHKLNELKFTICSRGDVCLKPKSKTLFTTGSHIVRPVSTFPAAFWQLPLFKGSRAVYPEMATLETINFDNLALRVLPIDPKEENNIRQVKGACFSLVKPTPVKNPSLVACSVPVLSLLDLSESQCTSSEFVAHFAGNKLLPGSQTAAHCYCGHQFGNFAGQLGDGAAIYLGEIVNKKGERWEIQLKGAGKTPYSRQADGRKVLRSTIREFLCSEAMFHLGIPTSRALSCITSDTDVIRDIFYSGNPIHEKCTIVCRVAETFIRFGSFQICKPPDRMTGREGPSFGKLDVLEQLTDYVIKTFYTETWEQHKQDKAAACKEFFEEVVKRTARLVALWQCVGWCHGVLNTDNMSILGLTIDYGPYGFLDRYDPEFICNASDDGGRYTYKNQPDVCKWNCLMLAEALALMSHVDLESLTPVLDKYQEEFDQHYIEQMRKKLGLKTESETDRDLVDSFLDTMEKTGSDFTNSFRCLSHMSLPGLPDFEKNLDETLTILLEQCCTLDELIKASGPRMDPRQLQMFLMLLEMNPQLLSQLGTGHKTIAQEVKRNAKVKELKETTQEMKSDDDRTLWKMWLERYAERLQQDTAEAPDLEARNRERVHVMNSNNPRVILRNYIAQNAIAAAEKGDYSEVRRVLKVLQSPYSEHVDLGDLAESRSPSAVQDENPGASAAAAKEPSPSTCSQEQQPVDYCSKPPAWALDLKVT